jgi:hypothetical protein
VESIEGKFQIQVISISADFEPKHKPKEHTFLLSFIFNACDLTENVLFYRL